MLDRLSSNKAHSSDDEGNQQDIGYKSTLHRSLNIMELFSIGFTQINVLISVVGLFKYGLITGGPALMFWGYTAVAFFTFITALCLAELCSAFPVTGSVYYWAGQLAPKQNAAFISYWTGLLNCFGNISGVASVAFLTAQFFKGAAVISSFSGIHEQDEVGIAIAVVFTAAIANLFRIDQIGLFISITTFFQLAAIIAICVTVLTMCPKLADSQVVFTTYYNDTGFRNKVYVVIISLLFGAYNFSGYDAPAQMSEESKYATATAPYGIISAVVISAIFGLFLVTSLLFGMMYINEAIIGSSGIAAFEVIIQATNPECATAFAWIIAVNAVICVICETATASRCVYALIRDEFFPYHELLYKTDPYFKSPIYAVFIVVGICAILLLLPLNTDGDTAFASLCETSVLSFNMAYFIPIALRLYYFDADNFPAGTFSLGKWSPLLYSIALVWLVVASVIFFFPTRNPVTAANMNYSIVIITGLIVLGMINWKIFLENKFSGPKRPINFNVSDGGLDADNRESSASESDSLLKRRPSSYMI